MVICLSRTVRLGYSYSDHMFLALREPSVVVFNKLHVAPPSSFATLESPVAPEGSCHNLREYGSERSSEPSGSVMCCPKHNEDSGHHLRTPYLNELFDASSSSANLRVDASSSSVNLRASFGSRHLREGAIAQQRCVSACSAGLGRRMPHLRVARA